MNRFFKNKLNNRGVAIETAVMFMVVISLVCMLLLTVSLAMNSQSKLVRKQTSRIIDLYDIGDRFVNDPENFIAGAEESEVYDIVKEDSETAGRYVLRVSKKSDGEQLLKIEAGTDKKVYKWIVSEDESSEDGKQ